MTSAHPADVWDAIRAWADTMGLLRPNADQTARPEVPQSVCDNCPICQAAATLDQVDPQIVSELSGLARNLLTGMESALAAAAGQRRADPPAGDWAEGDWAEGDPVADPDSSID